MLLDIVVYRNITGKLSMKEFKNTSLEHMVLATAGLRNTGLNDLGYDKLQEPMLLWNRTLPPISSLIN